jgi:hypothetical protein
MLATLAVTLPGITRCRFPNANMVNKLGTAYHSMHAGQESLLKPWLLGTHQGAM